MKIKEQKCDLEVKRCPDLVQSYGSNGKPDLQDGGSYWHSGKQTWRRKEPKSGF